MKLINALHLSYHDLAIIGINISTWLINADNTLTWIVKIGSAVYVVAKAYNELKKSFNKEK